MEKLHEHDIVQAYKGKPFDIEKLSKVAYKNGNNRYIAGCHNYKGELLDLFGITSILLERWGFYGIEFSVFINIKGNEIESCALDKCKYYCGGHGRPTVKVLQPTQQELRVFKRVMEYITI
jgi:hypothetical protein